MKKPLIYLSTWCLVIGATQRAAAQVPSGYTVTPVKKTYQKINNAFLKQGANVNVQIIKGKAYLEGDILLGTETELDAFQNRVTGFAVVADPSLTNGRWDGGIVPFVISDGFTAAERQIIVNAMNHIAANTNVCFRNRNGQSSYIRFKKYTVDQLGFSGGASFLGKCNFCTDGQEIMLSFVGDRVVRHEICHALGVMHEQSREDRDNFVEILTNNIQTGFQDQFDKSIYTSTDVGRYDFASIMHYFSTAFGRVVDGRSLQTIRDRANPANISFGTDFRLSAGDIQGINSMYTREVICAAIPQMMAGELEVGQSRTMNIAANQQHNFTGVYMRAGQTFEFTTTSPGWRNGSTETTCAGYAGNILDAARRHNDLNMMALVGELFEQNNDKKYLDFYFRIGCSRTFSPTKSGYLNAFANDIFAVGYGDNSGLVTLTVRRTQ